MTYFMFLALFLGIPIAILSVVSIVDFRRGKWLPESLAAWPAWVVMIGLCVVAFTYTTPWDNYLVATSVWWYDIDLVNGLVIGYVPIEEYTFFLVQPVMTSLLLLLFARYLPSPNLAKNDDSMRIRVRALGFVGAIWAISTIVLILTFVSDAFAPATYMTLELSWALIPVMIQLGFGADILWRHRRVVGLTIVVSTLYLSWADAIAITSGTWTIDPAQSFNIFLGGVLPIEEFLFFFLTNTLVTFGLTLVIAEASQKRVFELEQYAVLRPVVRLLPRKSVREG